MSGLMVPSPDPAATSRRPHVPLLNAADRRREIEPFVPASLVPSKVAPSACQDAGQP